MFFISISSGPEISHELNFPTPGSLSEKHQGTSLRPFLCLAIGQGLRELSLTGKWDIQGKHITL